MYQITKVTITDNLEPIKREDISMYQITEEEMQDLISVQYEMQTLLPYLTGSYQRNLKAAIDVMKPITAKANVGKKK